MITTACVILKEWILHNFRLSLTITEFSVCNTTHVHMKKGVQATFGFHEMPGNYRVASRVVLSPIELVS
jgi:hypothetical protein